MLRTAVCVAGAIALVLIAAAPTNAAYADVAPWPGYLIFGQGGGTISDYWGVDLDGLGDINGDGISEYIVGVPNGGGSGRGYVFDGATNTIIYTKAGNLSGDYFGNSVRASGDINNDGINDFIVAADLADPFGVVNAGSVYIYDGATGANVYAIHGTGTGDELGNQVDFIPDLNGDGKDEFIIAAIYDDPGGLNDAGSAFVYDGATGALIYTKSGAVATDVLGYAVAGLRDINGDGLGDFMVGAPQADPGGVSGAGTVYVYDGATGSLVYQIDGTTMFEYVGVSLADVGDINGDSLSEFIIGAAEVSPTADPGVARVYDGATGSMIYELHGENVGDAFGALVEGVGDIDNDGTPDFLVTGLDTDPHGAADAGSAYLYSGATGTLIYRMDGEYAGDSFGQNINDAGDLTRDGTNELLIGAVYYDAYGVMDAGFHYVIGFRSTHIDAITDVGNDQGKQLRLRWRARPLGDTTVTSYSIFRRQDNTKAVVTPPPHSEWATSLPPGNWDYVTTVPAFGDTAYQTVVPTLVDSTAAAGTQWSVFFVRMATDDPLLYLDTAPDSAYSIDNLAPAPPAPLLASESNGMVDLSWTAAAAADFDHFAIYRGTEPGFATTPATLIGTATDPAYSDIPTGGVAYYKVSALDHAGNESAPSNEVSVTPCACPFQCDFDANGFLDALDLNREIDALFYSGSNPEDPGCLTTRADFDASGSSDAIDLNGLIDHLFFGGAGPLDACSR